MQYLNYKEDKLPLKLSFSAMKRFNAESGKNILKLGDDLSLDDIENLLYASYLSGCKAEEKVAKYKKTDMEDILDEVYQEFIAIIPKLTAVKKK